MTTDDVLREYLTIETPFGPVATEDIKDPVARAALFDDDNKIQLEAIRREPGFLVGRRGSGKTAFLREIEARADTFATSVDTSTSFALFSELIRHLSTSRHRLFVSQVNQLWEAGLWHCILLKAANDQGRIGRRAGRTDIVKYIGGLVPRPERTSAEGILNRFSTELRAQATDNTTLLPDQLDLLVSGGTFFEDARDSAIKIFRELGLRPMILLDSTEDYSIAVEQEKEAISGLFNLIGERSRARRSKPTGDLTVTASIPAELWHNLQPVAFAPLKDFRNHLTLHWHSRELIKIAAKRLQVFMRLHETSHFRRNLSGLDPNRFDDAVQVLNFSLPNEIVNGLGTYEPAFTYILRHTQLLPRHFIMLLNSIWQDNLELGSGSVKVTQEAIQTGIKAVEGDIVLEICKAYESSYPWAYKAVEAAVKEVELCFSDGELHEVFNHHVKGALKGLVPSYRDFKRMLIEIGVVGRYLGTSEKYISAEFEYTRQNTLPVGDDEILCLHPLAAGVFNAKGARLDSEAETRMPVYPYGADPSDNDYRRIARR